MTHDLTPPFSRGGLALIGYRGTGKSTVGRILADRLDRPFLGTVSASINVVWLAGLTRDQRLPERGEPFAVVLGARLGLAWECHAEVAAVQDVREHSAQIRDPHVLAGHVRGHIAVAATDCTSGFLRRKE